MCVSNPCLHGNCSAIPGSFVCHCQTGWTGSRCDEGKLWFQVGLKTHRKHYNAKKASLLIIRSLLLFKSCFSDLDECKFRVCGLNGTCSNTVGAYLCHCFDGVTGQNCDTGKAFGIFYSYIIWFIYENIKTNDFPSFLFCF